MGAATCTGHRHNYLLRRGGEGHVHPVNASYVLSQVVSSTGSVHAEGTHVGLLASVCLEVVTQVLAAVPALEDLAAHGTRQGRTHGLEREHIHPSGYQVPLDALDSNRTDSREATGTSLDSGSYTSLPSSTCAPKSGMSLGNASLTPHLNFLEVLPGASVSYES